MTWNKSEQRIYEKRRGRIKMRVLMLQNDNKSMYWVVERPCYHKIKPGDKLLNDYDSIKEAYKITSKVERYMKSVYNVDINFRDVQYSVRYSLDIIRKYFDAPENIDVSAIKVQFTLSYPIKYNAITIIKKNKNHTSYGRLPQTREDKFESWWENHTNQIKGMFKELFKSIN